MSSSTSSMAPSPSFATTSENTPPAISQQIYGWLEGNKQVAVFKSNDDLTYSITEGSQVETGKISLALYDLPKLRDFAPKFIGIFRKVLVSDGIKPSFLPTFFVQYKRPSPSSDLLLALFAQVRRTEWGKEVVQAKWGIRALEKGSEAYWLDVTDQGTKDFLTGAPIYRKEMDEYNNHFKEVVTLDTDQKVQAITMRCVSNLDRDIFLDENTWAVTLISAQKSAGWGNFFRMGHGSIAWEGVEAGSYFLKWADITTAYENRQPGEARIRIIDRTFPSTSWLLGPTCARPKNLVGRMVAHISQDITLSEGASWSSTVKFMFFAPFRNMFKSAWDVEEERRRLESLENCLSFAISALKRAEIFLPEPGRVEPIFEPNIYVMSIRTNYVAKINQSWILYLHKDEKNPINKVLTSAFIAHAVIDVREALIKAVSESVSDTNNNDDDDG